MAWSQQGPFCCRVWCPGPTSPMVPSSLPATSSQMGFRPGLSFLFPAPDSRAPRRAVRPTSHCVLPSVHACALPLADLATHPPHAKGSCLLSQPRISLSSEGTVGGWVSVWMDRQMDDGWLKRQTTG